LISILLVTIFSIALISCGKSKQASSKASVSKNISIEESKKLIDDNKVDLILDVRDEKQFKEGHLPKATLISYKEVKNKISELKNFKDKPILIYCNSGKKSADSIKILEENGFNNIFHMVDGINKWHYEIEK
ncbi:rhodanese-like domain-containing protein, partial [Clostridium tarantellae]